MPGPTHITETLEKIEAAIAELPADVAARVAAALRTPGQAPVGQQTTGTVGPEADESDPPGAPSQRRPRGLRGPRRPRAAANPSVDPGEADEPDEPFDQPAAPSRRQPRAEPTDAEIVERHLKNRDRAARRKAVLEDAGLGPPARAAREPRPEPTDEDIVQRELKNRERRERRKAVLEEQGLGPPTKEPKGEETDDEFVARHLATIRRRAHRQNVLEERGLGPSATALPAERQEKELPQKYPPAHDLMSSPYALHQFIGEMLASLGHVTRQPGGTHPEDEGPPRKRRRRLDQLEEVPPEDQLEEVLPDTQPGPPPLTPAPANAASPTEQPGPPPSPAAPATPSRRGQDFDPEGEVARIDAAFPPTPPGLDTPLAATQPAPEQSGPPGSVREEVLARHPDLEPAPRTLPSDEPAPPETLAGRATRNAEWQKFMAAYKERQADTPSPGTGASPPEQPGPPTPPAGGGLPPWYGEYLNLKNISAGGQLGDKGRGRLDELQEKLNELAGITPPPPVKQSYEFGFNKGGEVRGEPGTDKVPARLTPGEEVIPAEQASKNRGLLERVREGRGEEDYLDRLARFGSVGKARRALSPDEPEPTEWPGRQAGPPRGPALPASPAGEAFADFEKGGGNGGGMGGSEGLTIMREMLDILRTWASERRSQPRDFGGNGGASGGTTVWQAGQDEEGFPSASPSINVSSRGGVRGAGGWGYGTNHPEPAADEARVDYAEPNRRRPFQP